MYLSSRSYDRIIGRVFINRIGAANHLVRKGLDWDWPHYDKEGLYINKKNKKVNINTIKSIKDKSHQSK